jgi:hypothetical protein
MENLTNSDINNEMIGLDKSALKHLEETRKWTFFLSVLGFVMIGLMSLVFILMLVIGGLKAIPGLEVAPLLPILLISFIYFYPVYLLLQFSKFSKQAILNRSSELLTKAMLNLKRLYKFMGIFAIIAIGIYLILILIVVATRGFTNV